MYLDVRTTVSGTGIPGFSHAGPNQPGGQARGAPAYPLDPAAAARLWQVSADTLAG